MLNKVLEMNMAKLNLRIGLRTLANITANMDTSPHKKS